MNHKHSKPEESLSEEIRQKQRNTIWPDALRNSKSVDMFLWHGTNKPTRIQRAGAIVFGLFFLIGAISFASICAEAHTIIFAPIAFGFLYAGARIFYNGIRRSS